jgi:hypothetical protein
MTVEITPLFCVSGGDFASLAARNPFVSIEDLAQILGNIRRISGLAKIPKGGGGICFPATGNGWEDSRRGELRLRRGLAP